jgi:hypothetical protein
VAEKTRLTLEIRPKRKEFVAIATDQLGSILEVFGTCLVRGSLRIEGSILD